ncbi:uncharacterized protein LOC110983482 [Acanthaster planci]|uniref:Uncharacterized protein LOC110983482 n=1 Tax=Acanthaster planci TaxID=133434 RepID=A0A8B7YYP6_ACAPL|nr:uncharacterized protein LOC110983482 [Acanthaster planci]
MSRTGGFSSCYCGWSVVGLLLLISARVCCGQQVADIQDSKQETIYARSGDIVTLPCNQSVPSPSPSLSFVPFFLQWRRLDLPFPFYISFADFPPYVDSQYAGRVSVEEDLSLRIDGVVAEDDGLYECQVIVLTGSYDNIGNGTFVHLIIIGPPRFLSTPPALVIFHEGKHETLQCVAKGTPTPTVTWQKDGGPLTSNHIRTTVNSIVFEGVRQDDSGTYVCKAESEEGAVQHTVRLLVHGAPFIFIPPHNLTVISGELAIFECESEASPDNATQRWYRGSDLIQQSSQYEFLPEDGLMIREVQPQDEGWYSCSPTNGLGVDPSARAYLDVQYPAVVASMPPDAYISRGLDVTLSCPVDADPPLLNVVWRKDGSEVIVQQSLRYRISDEGGLTIFRTDLGDSGSYTCTPYNKIGTAGESTVTLLTVRDPPQFVTRPKSLYQRLLGEDITIPCSATGDPAPTMSWHKVDGKLPPLRSSVSQDSLMIRGLTKEDHGIYHCQATNQIAAVVTTTQLIVELTSPHEPYNVTVATTISSARVAWQPAYNGGFTQTYTVWYLEAGVANEEWTTFDQIPEDINFHIVYNLKPSTEYLFAVVASNQLGQSLFSEMVSATTKDAGELVSPTDETGKTLIPIYIGLTPSPPQNLSILPTQEGLLLSWYPPTLWGQFVNRYSIEYRLHGPWVVMYDRVDGSQLDQLLERLQPNTTYQFRMFAFTPVLYSSPSEMVTGFTGDIPAYMPPKPTTEGTPQYGEPGILPGVIAGICFLFVSLLLSVLAVCIYNRRKKKKRQAFFSIAAQTPQPLIHRPQPAQSAETPTPATVKPVGLVSKLILKISPKHKADPASAPHPNRHAHLTSNGKLPTSRSEPSLSERLLVRSARQRRSPGRYRESGVELPGGRAGSRGEAASRQLASEQALELDEFGPSSPGGVYSVQDGRIRAHGLYGYGSSYPCHSGGESSETNKDEDDSDTSPDTHSNVSPGVRPLDYDDSSRPVRGDYVYYHGNMFITSNSDDNEDYGWADVPQGGYHSGDTDEGGVVNPAMVTDDSGAPPPRRTPPTQNQYVDMPTKNHWRWDREWADDTLSHSHPDGHRDTPPHSQDSVNRQRTLPRHSTRKNIQRLSRDDFRSGPPPEYHSSPPWSDSISTIQGNSMSTRHPDYADLDYGKPPWTKVNQGRDESEYGGPHGPRQSAERRTRKSSCPDYDKLRNSPRRRSPQRSQSADIYGEPRMSRKHEKRPSLRFQGTHKIYGTPLAAKRSTSPHRHESNYAERTRVPRAAEDLYDHNTDTRGQRSGKSRRSPSKADSSPDSEQYRKPVQQVMKRSPVRTIQGTQGRTDPVIDPREGHSGAASVESCADEDTLQGTLQEAESTVMDNHGDERYPVDGMESPVEGAKPVESAVPSPAMQSLVGGAKPKLYERVSPQGGSKLKVYDDIPKINSPFQQKRSSLSPRFDSVGLPTHSSRGRNYDTLPLPPTEGSVRTSVSPTAMSANSRASMSSMDSRPGSTKPIPLPQSYISAHQRSLLSPNSQYSASSGYASRNTSQSMSSRGRTSSVPSIHDPTSSATTTDGVDSPFSDSAGPFSNVSSKESEEPYFEFDPMLHESDLRDALKKYYQPVDIPTPSTEEVYKEGNGKVADMEKRCEELKKEFQEYQRQQARAKHKSRITSSV